MKKQFVFWFSMIVSWNTAFGDITGDLQVCPNTPITYSFPASCTHSISDIEWYVSNNLGSFNFTTANDLQSFTVTWDQNLEGAETGTITVDYNCNNIDPVTHVITTTPHHFSKEITIYAINRPFFDQEVLFVPCDQELVTLTPAGQHSEYVDYSYEWTYPECFSGDNDQAYGSFTTTPGSEGPVCVTISIDQCETALVTECITIERVCEDYKIISANIDDITKYVSANISITTVGSVSTAAEPNVEFKAGGFVLLDPGFLGVPNFLAHIAPCTCLPEGFVGCFRNMEVTHEQQVTSSNKVTGYLLQVYPNPTNSFLTIEIKNVGETKEGTLFLYNAIGKLLQQVPVTSEKMNLDLSAYDNGIYLVSYSNGKSNNVVRVSKTN